MITFLWWYPVFLNIKILLFCCIKLLFSKLNRFNFVLWNVIHIVCACLWKFLYEFWRESSQTSRFAEICNSINPVDPYHIACCKVTTFLSLFNSLYFSQSSLFFLTSAQLRWTQLCPSHEATLFTHTVSLCLSLSRVSGCASSKTNEVEFGRRVTCAANATASRLSTLSTLL